MGALGELAIWEERREARREAAAEWLGESGAGGQVGGDGWRKPTETGQHRLPGCETSYGVSG